MFVVVLFCAAVLVVVVVVDIRAKRAMGRGHAMGGEDTRSVGLI